MFFSTVATMSHNNNFERDSINIINSIMFNKVHIIVLLDIIYTLIGYFLHIVRKPKQIRKTSIRVSHFQHGFVLSLSLSLCANFDTTVFITYGDPVETDTQNESLRTVFVFMPKMKYLVGDKNCEPCQLYVMCLRIKAYITRKFVGCCYHSSSNSRKKLYLTA